MNPNNHMERAGIYDARYVSPYAYCDGKTLICNDGQLTHKIFKLANFWRPYMHYYSANVNERLMGKVARERGKSQWIDRIIFVSTKDLDHIRRAFIHGRSPVDAFSRLGVTRDAHETNEDNYGTFLVNGQRILASKPRPFNAEMIGKLPLMWDSEDTVGNFKIK